MVGIARIKICESVPQELIHHLIQLFQINVLLCPVNNGKTHKTKS